MLFIAAQVGHVTDADTASGESDPPETLLGSRLHARVRHLRPPYVVAALLVVALLLSGR